MIRKIAIILRYIATALLVIALGVEFVQAITGGLISGLAQTTIGGITGSFTTGAGMSANQKFMDYYLAPWGPYNTANNVITQSTGSTNVLRNSTMTAADHFRYMTLDAPISNPYKVGVSQFSATIDNGSGGSGNLLTVQTTPTGTIQLFQRVTDILSLSTTAATAIPSVGSPSCINSAASCSIQVVNSAGVLNGMHIDDVTYPRGIGGNATITGVPDGTHITVSFPVGFGDNTMGSNGNKLVGNGIGSGDALALGLVPRGTMIVGLGSCGTTPSYPCNYVLNNNALISGVESMQSAGAMCSEGIYIIPVATPGTSNYVTCTHFVSTGFTGTYTPQNLVLTVTGTLSDLIVRFPIDYIDASRLNCSLWAGAFAECVNTNLLIQPVTFHLMATYDQNYGSLPSIDTKNGCPLNSTNLAGTNTCADIWTNATTDLYAPNLPGCPFVGSRIQCEYAYTWVPTGVHGGMEINYHTGLITDTLGKVITINGFELKQTPGATCVTSPGNVINQPPCFQYFPGPLEISEISADLIHNARFTQTIGPGSSTGWNGGSGILETTPAFVAAGSTSTFIAEWPLSVAMRCPFWDDNSKGAPTCSRPNVYFPASVSDYKFENGAAEFVATGLSVLKYGAKSIILSAASTGMTAGQPGFVQFGSAGKDLILVDSSWNTFGD